MRALALIESGHDGGANPLIKEILEGRVQLGSQQSGHHFTPFINYQSVELIQKLSFATSCRIIN